MARHAPTSRARVILTSHFWPMNQKSSPTRQLKTQTATTKKHLLTQSSPGWKDRYQTGVQACLCVLLLANWRLVHVMCTDAVVVTVVKVADRGTTIV